MLPFIAGAVAGAVAVLAFNNKKQIEKSLVKSASKAKKIASSGYEKVKDIAVETKDKIEDKVECLKSKNSSITDTTKGKEND
ncbi:MAG: hypothetical protein RBQ81_01680 [Arcobacteraceae bacterium]|jgi:gas vesicle protein|nr:hypothetical protein [Arcobacteraceae bacterium]